MEHTFVRQLNWYAFIFYKAIYNIFDFKIGWNNKAKITTSITLIDTISGIVYCQVKIEKAVFRIKIMSRDSNSFPIADILTISINFKLFNYCLTRY